MHPQFLDLLCSPDSKEPLTLEATEYGVNGLVISGSLTTPSGKRYPIVRGVPRFVDESAYASSFGYEWNRWPRVQFESENVGRPMAGHTTRMWKIQTGVNEDQLYGQTVVEFGCGPGRFLDVARRFGARAVGLDITTAVDSARRNFPDDPDVLIVQGDVFHPPFRDNVFDGGFSLGVLHHTPSPQTGVQRLTATVKPNGWVAVSVYSQDSLYNYPSLARLRWVYRLILPLLGYRPALGYAAFSAFLVSPILGWARARGIRGSWFFQRHLLFAVVLPDWRWSLLDAFDAITPEIATVHTHDEVESWMQAAGCSQIRTTEWGPTHLVGFKFAQ